MTLLERSLKDETGATAIEYVLIAAFRLHYCGGDWAWNQANHDVHKVVGRAKLKVRRPTESEAPGTLFTATLAT